jgi:hypothetical protein
MSVADRSRRWWPGATPIPRPAALGAAATVAIEPTLDGQEADLVAGSMSGGGSR